MLLYRLCLHIYGQIRCYNSKSNCTTKLVVCWVRIDQWLLSNGRNENRVIEHDWVTRKLVRERERDGHMNVFICSRWILIDNFFSLHSSFLLFFCEYSFICSLFFFILIRFSFFFFWSSLDMPTAVNSVHKYGTYWHSWNLLKRTRMFIITYCCWWWQ